MLIYLYINNEQRGGGGGSLPHILFCSPFPVRTTGVIGHVFFSFFFGHHICFLDARLHLSVTM